MLPRSHKGNMLFFHTAIAGGKMDTNLKAVKALLETRNFFEHKDFCKETSLENLNNATTLENLIIVIEKHFCMDRFQFQYDSKTQKFMKNEIMEDEELYASDGCKECELKCFKSEYTVEEFIKLCEIVFRPVAVQLA